MNNLGIILIGPCNNNVEELGYRISMLLDRDGLREICRETRKFDAEDSEFITETTISDKENHHLLKILQDNTFVLLALEGENIYSLLRKISTKRPEIFYITQDEIIAKQAFLGWMPEIYDYIKERENKKNKLIPSQKLDVILEDNPKNKNTEKLKEFTPNMPKLVVNIIL